MFRTSQPRTGGTAILATTVRAAATTGISLAHAGVPVSKHETPMIRWYWKQAGGTLIEEFRAAKRSNDCDPRLLDGVIVRNRETRIADRSEVSLKEEDVIVVQAKRGRLGMCLMGRACFSAWLINRFSPRSITPVPLCESHDSELSPILQSYRNMKVVIYPSDSMA